MREPIWIDCRPAGRTSKCSSDQSSHLPTALYRINVANRLFRPFPPKLYLPHLSPPLALSPRCPPLPLWPPVLRGYLDHGSDEAQNPSTSRNTCLLSTRPKSSALLALAGVPPATTPPRGSPGHLTILDGRVCLCSLPLGAPPPDMPTIPARPRTCTPPPEVPLPPTSPTPSFTTPSYHGSAPRCGAEAFSSPPVWAWPADRPDTRRLASSPAANLPRRAEPNEPS